MLFSKDHNFMSNQNLEHSLQLVEIHRTFIKKILRCSKEETNEIFLIKYMQISIIVILFSIINEELSSTSTK